MATRLTHKVRNPKNLDQWLELWTAEIITTDDPNNPIDYTINPSKKWNINIPITNVTVESGENIVTSNIQKDDNGDNDEGLAYINWNKITKVIKADRGLSIDEDSDTIGHILGNIDDTSGGSENTSGPSINIPIITYDSYGHITAIGTKEHTVDDLTNSNIASNAKINPTKIQIKDTYNDNNSTITSGLETYVKRMISGYTPVYPNTEESFTGIFNTKNQDGIVKKVIVDNNNTNTNTIWAANNNSEPDWRKITADMFDSDTEINAENLPKNSSNSAGIIPENSNPSLVWGTPSITYEEQDPLYVANHIHDHIYYLYDENSSSYREILDSDWINIPAGTTYYIKKEYPPQWSGISLNKTNLNIAYDNDNSKLIIGLNEQVWQTKNSEDNQIPDTWNQYVLTTDTNITITPSSS